MTTVCPSGFWGFRHRLGMPVSLHPDTDSGTDALPAQVAFAIEYSERPELSVAVSTDPEFELRPAHERALRALRDDLGWHYADTRTETLRLLRDTPAHLVYFYCHGGLLNNIPFLQVGGRQEPGITSDNFRSYRIRWRSPRPLVFINGCHTTAVEPEQAFNFVSTLVETAAAAGVIGTEITNFEPLAGAFAEECLGRFLAGAPIGDAVRNARLALLKRGNPLGLVYVPFALPNLHLLRVPDSAMSDSDLLKSDDLFPDRG